LAMGFFVVMLMGISIVANFRDVNP
jgi:hypothetical protein